MNKAYDVMNDVFMILAEKHGLRAADSMIYPLTWSYSRGLMSHDQEYALKHLNRKQEETVAKKLERGGSIEAIAARIMSYLNKFKVTD